MKFEKFINFELYNYVPIFIIITYYILNSPIMIFVHFVEYQFLTFIDNSILAGYSSNNDYSLLTKIIIFEFWSKLLNLNMLCRQYINTLYSISLSVEPSFFGGWQFFHCFEFSKSYRKTKQKKCKLFWIVRYPIFVSTWIIKYLHIKGFFFVNNAE